MAPARPQDELDAGRPVPRPGAGLARSPGRSASIEGARGRHRRSSSTARRSPPTRSSPTRGARTGLLVTEGFRDTLALRERSARGALRQPPAAARAAGAALLAARRRAGATDYKGDEVTPLARGRRPGGRDVCRPPASRRSRSRFSTRPSGPGPRASRAREPDRELLPGRYATASSDLLSQVRYYDRTSTTVLNAYVGPDHHELPRRRSRDASTSSAFGACCSSCSRTVASRRRPRCRAGGAVACSPGPASGPTAGLWQLAPHGVRDCITIDMGGTSFDAALVKDGEPLVMTDAVVDRWRLALPTIDIHTIGAGGGSIARVDDGRAAPRGAPERWRACPGRPATGAAATSRRPPTPTSSLGFLDEASFLAARCALDREAAVRALDERIAGPLGIDVVEAAAAGVYDLVNVTMATGVREVSVRRGLDPRDFPLVVAGGAGPLHAAAIAHELEIPMLLVPRESSIFCAAGMLMSDFKHDYVRAYTAHARRGGPRRRSAGLLAEMEPQGRAVARRASASSPTASRFERDARPALRRPVARADRAGATAARLQRSRSPSMPSTTGSSATRRRTSAGRDCWRRLSAVGPDGRSPRSQAFRLGRGGRGRCAAGASRRLVAAATRPRRDARLRWHVRSGRDATLTGPAIVELANTTIVGSRGVRAGGSIDLAPSCCTPASVALRSRGGWSPAWPGRQGHEHGRLRRARRGHDGRRFRRTSPRAGHAVVVHDIDPGRAQALVEQGARAAASPRELARTCDSVIVALPDTPHILAAGRARTVCRPVLPP